MPDNSPNCGLLTCRPKFWDGSRGVKLGARCVSSSQSVKLAHLAQTSFYWFNRRIPIEKPKILRNTPRELTPRRAASSGLFNKRETGLRPQSSRVNFSKKLPGRGVCVWQLTRTNSSGWLAACSPTVVYFRRLTVVKKVHCNYYCHRKASEVDGMKEQYQLASGVGR